MTGPPHQTIPSGVGAAGASIRTQPTSVGGGGPGGGLPILCAALGGALGLLALAIWAAGAPGLRSLSPALMFMQPWTAVSSVLLSVALILRARGGRGRLAGSRAFAVGVAAIAGLMLVQQATGWASGFDRLLFREVVLTQTLAHPGRMAEATAAGLILLSTALLLPERGRIARRLFTVCATAALLIGAIGLSAHLFGARELSTALGFRNVALPTATALALFALGALALRPDQGWPALMTGDNPGAQAVRRLGPLVLGVPVLVGTLGQQGSRAGLYDEDFRLALITVATTVILAGVTLWAGARLNSLEALRRAERERQETEARLRMAIEAGRLGAWSFDVPTRTVTWDARTREMFGVAKTGPMAVEDFLRLIHPDDRRRVSEVGERSLDPAGDGRYDVEHRIVRPDGRVVWLAHDGQVIFTEDGIPAQAVGITTDVTERKQAELHQRLLVNELNHRVKNTLATVQAIAAQSLREGAEPEAAKRSFTARLVALSRAHDILTQESWEGADLGEVVRASVEAFDAEGRFDLDGPTLRLSPKAALSLALALHELGTNAAKYGALSGPEGRIAVGWRVDEAGGRWLLEWRESGGPAVRTPERRGFGSRLIERGLAAELRGEVGIAFEPGGVVCRVEAPLETVAA